MSEIFQTFKNKYIYWSNHQGFRKYFTNTSWLFAEKSVKIFVGFFVSIWIARYLGPNQFGLLNYSQSFVALFTAVATLGLDGIVVRELVKDETKQNEILGTSFVLKVMGSSLAIIFIAVALFFSSNDKLTNILIFIIAFSLFFQSFNVVDYYFQSQVLSKYVVFANIITLILSNIVKVVLILNNASLVYFAWTILFDSIILASGLIYFFSKKANLKIPNFTFNKTMMITLLQDAWPLMFAGIASMINMRVDQVMLGKMTDFEVVGNYAAAVRISELWLILPTLIGTSIYPAVISSKKKSHELYLQRVRRIICYMASFAIPFAILVTILSELIVTMLYGDKYLFAHTYLSIYIWSGLPYVVFFVMGQVVMIESLTKVTFYISVISVFANIILNKILIHLYGGVGAAMTTLFVAYVSQLIIIFYVYNKTKFLKRRKT